MRLLYSLLYTCAFLLISPYFILVGLIRGKYLKTISQRLGLIPCNSTKPSIWVHAVSVGEFLASKSLLKRIRDEFPEIPLFVSTTTITGQSLAKQILPGSAFYFPFDWVWCIRRVLRKIQPQLVLVLETEIWPNFLWTLESQKIPALLINGRISDRSLKRYQLVRSWLPKFTESWMQSEEDARRMQLLGAREVFVMGNLKYDFQSPKLPQEVSRLIEFWKGRDLLWIAGSTMPGEEKLILDVFSELRKKFPLKLLIAPRHPERFTEVASAIGDSGQSFALRSQNRMQQESILLLDSIGELAGVYQFADIVLIGGTLLSSGGGHNPIEPAFYGKAILAGPNYFNFRAVFEEFRQRNAIVITSDLFTACSDLLENPTRRSQLGDSAKRLIDENTGATEKVMNGLRRHLQTTCLA